MARARISGFDEVDKLFDKLEDMKQVSVKAVEAAAPHLVKGAKNAVHSAASKGYTTEQLENSFAAMKPKTNDYGAYVVVRPIGRDSDGHDYYARGAYLEFGTTLKGDAKNSPQPWRDKAVNNARSDCEKEMEDTVFSEVDKF